MTKIFYIFLLIFMIIFKIEAHYNTPAPRNVDFLKENQNFTIHFYSELIKIYSSNDKNLVFSPYSIQSAGAALYAGSDGDTAREMEEGLHFPSHDINVLGDIYKKFVELMKNSSMFNMGTKIYIDKSYTIEPKYQDIIMKFFNTKIESIDFNENSLMTVNSINEWIGGKTEGKIQNVVNIEDINELTQLLLLNVVHFKGKWLIEFDKNKIKQDDFTSEPGNIIQLDMMHGIMPFKSATYQELNINVAELFFQDNDITLILLFPNSPQIKLKEIENKLTKLLFEDMIFNKTGRKENRYIIMPKFTIESDIDMENIFKNMGISDMFTSKANFANLLNSTESKIKMSKVFHKSILEIMENGVEKATATTNSEIDKTVTNNDEPFRVNQSFLYFIRGKYGEIYFMGRFTGK